MPHANARLTVHGRRLLVQRVVHDRRPVAHLAKEMAIRYERDRPGELAHRDVKKIGRIRDGGGWRAHGRAVTSTSERRHTRVGFDYVHWLVRRPTSPATASRGSSG